LNVFINSATSNIGAGFRVIGKDMTTYP